MVRSLCYILPCMDYPNDYTLKSLLYAVVQSKGRWKQIKINPSPLSYFKASQIHIHKQEWHQHSFHSHNREKEYNKKTEMSHHHMWVFSLERKIDRPLKTYLGIWNPERKLKPSSSSWENILSQHTNQQGDCICTYAETARKKCFWSVLAGSPVMTYPGMRCSSQGLLCSYHLMFRLQYYNFL